MIRRFVVALSVLLLTASAAVAQDWSAEDKQQLNGFELTMDRVERLDRAVTATYNALKADPAHMAKIERRKAIESGEVEPTEAEMQALMQQAQEEEAAGSSLAGTVSKIEAQPTFVASIRSAGLTVQDAVLTQFALIQGAMAYGAKKQGLLKAIPKEISPQHVAFVAEHEQKVREYIEKWQGMNDVFGE